jgi:hypothetical protein
MRLTLQILLAQTRADRRCSFAKTTKKEAKTAIFRADSFGNVSVAKLSFLFNWR